jgi:hypothetical protein
LRRCLFVLTKACFCTGERGGFLTTTDVISASLEGSHTATVERGEKKVIPSPSAGTAVSSASDGGGWATGHREVVETVDLLPTGAVGVV